MKKCFTNLQEFREIYLHLLRAFLRFSLFLGIILYELINFLHYIPMYKRQVELNILKHEYLTLLELFTHLRYFLKIIHFNFTSSISLQLPTCTTVTMATLSYQPSRGPTMAYPWRPYHTHSNPWQRINKLPRSLSLHRTSSRITCLIIRRCM